jgi:hypothetical protein
LKAARRVSAGPKSLVFMEDRDVEPRSGSA